MGALTRQQQEVVRELLSAAQTFSASPREEKALLQAGRVETNFTPLPGGDRDSTGVLQQRPSQGWGPVGESVRTDALQFLRAARKARGVRGSAGVLAQAVQRSAFPERYDQHSAEADALMGSAAPSRGGGGRGTAPRAAEPAPGGQEMVPASTAGAEALLAAIQQPQQPRAVAGLQAPAFSARPQVAGGGQVPMSGGGPARGAGVDALLAAAAQTGVGAAPDVPTDGGGGAGARPTAAASPVPRAAGEPITDVKRVLARAAAIDSQKLPYVYGGGHGAKASQPGTPLDCSAAVSKALGIDPRVSGDFERFGSPGRDPSGKGITIYANKGHVLMEIGGRFWGTSKSNPKGGAGFIPRSQVSADYLKGFTARHLASSAR